MKYLKKDNSHPLLKAWIPAVVVLACLALLATAFGMGKKADVQIPADNEATMDTGAQSVISAEETHSVNVSEMAYDAVLQRYEAAVTDRWNPGQCIENGISLMVGYLLEQNVPFGYAYLDLNQNGESELVITDGSLIYDLYAIADDGPVQLLSGMERLSYRLCEGDYIAEFGSGSAFYSAYCYRKFNTSGTFEVCDEIVFDASVSETAPWFDNVREIPVTEAEARSVMESYVPKNIAFTPFA